MYSPTVHTPHQVSNAHYVSLGPSLTPCRGHSMEQKLGQLPYGAERCWALGSWFSSEGWEHAPITAHFVLGTV